MTKEEIIATAHQMSVPSRPPRNAGELFRYMREIPSNKWIAPPHINGVKLGGTGGPGKIIEIFCGSNGQNKAIADAAGIELKWTSLGALITCFHLTPIGFEDFVRNSWDVNKRLVHTIKPNDGFEVLRFTEGEKDFLEVHHNGNKIQWSIPEISNHAAKLQKVALFIGEKSMDRTEGHIDNTPHIRIFNILYMDKWRGDVFIREIGKKVKIDLDAYGTPSGIIRDHGTKFRIRHKDCHGFWERIRQVEPEGFSEINDFAMFWKGFRRTAPRPKQAVLKTEDYVDEWGMEGLI